MEKYLSDYPVPMSDEFLVLATDAIENVNYEVAVSLGLTRPEANKIQQDELLATDQHKLLVVIFCYWCLALIKLILIINKLNNLHFIIYNLHNIIMILK